MHFIIQKLKNKHTFLKNIQTEKVEETTHFDRTRGDKNQIFPTLAATGAFVGDSALICGGEMPKECYSLKPDSSKIVVQMNYTRVDAASVKLNDTRYFKCE